ncbi:outer membrane protein [Pseudoduganella sp. GCM10020061]|uniref:outer membrane protein n=1 Tax=Pseudoduganella sp. GCM10020061 TaxID=3317345 RepID=UPI0036318149
MKKVLIALIATAFAAPAFAADNYVSASVGRAKHKLEADGAKMSEKDTSFKAAVGHNFMPGVGVELGYVNFGETRVSGGGATAWAKPKSLYAAVVGEVPVADKFSVLGKLGVARSSTEIGGSIGGVTQTAKEKDTSAVIGLGAAYAFTDAVKLVAEYENFGKVAKGEGDSLKVDQVSVGLRVAF